MEEPKPYPTGTVTFLFTDIEGSTALWEQDRVAMAGAVERHLALLRRRCRASMTASLFKVVGDAVQAAFPTAPDAVAAALDAQQRTLLAETWPERSDRCGSAWPLHTAAAKPQDGDYLAAGLNRLARLLAAGHGGQVLLSLATQDLARDALPSQEPACATWASTRCATSPDPERVFQLLHPDLPCRLPTAAHAGHAPQQSARAADPVPWPGGASHPGRGSAQSSGTSGC